MKKLGKPNIEISAMLEDDAVSYELHKWTQNVWSVFFPVMEKENNGVLG